MMTRLRLFSAGSNAHGQLGNKTTDDSHVFQTCAFVLNDNSPRQYEIPGSRVMSVASGANHTLLLLEHRSEIHERRTEIWGCGDGRKGQLGPAWVQGGCTSHKSLVFRRIDHEILDVAGIDQAEYTINAIAASWESTYVILRSRHGLSRNDIVLSMGNDDYGNLGIDASSSSKSRHGPHQVALGAMFQASYAKVLSGFHVRRLAAGPHHVVATVRLFFEGGEEDVVIGWGASRHGQLSSYYQHKGLAKPPLTIISPSLISLGQTESNGAPDPINSFAAGNHHTVLLHRSGRIVGLGSNKKGQLSGLREELGVKSVHCTWNGTYCVSGDDDPWKRSTKSVKWELRATGNYDKGQLGYGSVASSPPSDSRVVRFPFNHDTHRLVDIACGSEHVLALFSLVNTEGIEGDENTEVWGWGWNEHGNLGLGHTADVHLPAMIWPRSEDGQASGCVLGIWAGCGTSWIVELEA